jgi:hypothetical protein
MTPPYAKEPEERWGAVTDRLLAEHPLKDAEIVAVVLSAWEGIFETRIGRLGFKIGTDIEPQPQIMGFLLHELIPLEFARRYPKKWRRQKLKAEKDLVYEPDPRYSVEIKTSSHSDQVFGNRSYGQPTKEGEVGRKGKSGYFLTVNFQKFSAKRRPLVTVIRFGWLDHTDWIAQAAATGQSARLRPEAYNFKLRQLYKIASD